MPFIIAYDRKWLYLIQNNSLSFVLTSLTAGYCWIKSLENYGYFVNIVMQHSQHSLNIGIYIEVRAYLSI